MSGEDGSDRDDSPVRSPGRDEGERLSRVRRVTHLTQTFEEGPVDPVGALKLYHAQAHKREMAKVCSSGAGRMVMQKARKFNDRSLPTSPRLSTVSGSDTSLDMSTGSKFQFPSLSSATSEPRSPSGQTQPAAPTPISTRPKSFLAAVTGSSLRQFLTTTVVFI